jgi:ribose transport system ATP-binding protein
VLPSEIHGLLGENGSGKSTLIKILAGYHEPDAGSLIVNGSDVRLPLRAGEYRDLGFEFVHQDLGLIPTLSVTENLYLSEVASPRNRWFISWTRAANQAAETFARYGVSIDPRATVQHIRPVERALLAIIRALEGLRADDESGMRATLLVLDEPTVFLPRHEVAVLFDFVRGVAKGGSSALFVSHDLDEVRELTDRITVLRDGRVAGTVVTSETSHRQLVQLIIGRELEDADGGPQLEVATQPVRIRVEGLTTPTLTDVTFDLHEGEVLGLTGLVGSGYEDVVYSLYGATPAAAGTVSVGGRRLPLTAITPRSLMGTFDVRPARPELEYGSFSGGNQQKAMMAKWQHVQPSVLLLHEPTQGVDIGARQQIFELIRDATRTSSTICASSDYEQLAAICDRVGVLARGRLVGFIAGADLTKERIADFCLRSSDAETLIT